MAVHKGENDTGRGGHFCNVRQAGRRHEIFLRLSQLSSSQTLPKSYSKVGCMAKFRTLCAQ